MFVWPWQPFETGKELSLLELTASTNLGLPSWPYAVVHPSYVVPHGDRPILRGDVGCETPVTCERKLIVPDCGAVVRSLKTGCRSGLSEQEAVSRGCPMQFNAREVGVELRIR